jgi:polar amino acid transport system permease protein
VPLWTRVILPQALARVLPPLGNYAIAMFKSTPYLAAITVNEMLGAALDEASQSFRYMEPILIVGLLFLIASCLVALLVRRMERLLPVRG